MRRMRLGKIAKGMKKTFGFAFFHYFESEVISPTIVAKRMTTRKISALIHFVGVETNRALFFFFHIRIVLFDIFLDRRRRRRRKVTIIMVRKKT
jgi:hypothetical protein